MRIAPTRIAWLVGLGGLGGLGAGVSVAHAEAPGEAAPTPYLEFLVHNDLRIGLQCAESLAIPSTGLRVAIDGVPQTATALNGETHIGYGKGGPRAVWHATDVGFDIAPGAHHLAISADGCASEARDIVISPLDGTRVTGRLAIDDPMLMGTVGAPNSAGILIGTYDAALPASTSVSGETAFASSTSTVRGLWLSTTFERRRLALAIDWRIGGGSLSGESRPINNSTAAPAAYTESLFQTSGAFRIGARLPLHDMALASGVGIGGSLTAAMWSPPTPPAVNAAPLGADASWFVPLWVAATYKPACNWGMQILAQYDLRPTNSSESNLELAAGLIYQPSRACSEPPGVRVH
jgi:hypothetical protein